MDENVTVKVSGVSKKFSRNLKSLMKYGIYDLGRNVLGMSVDSGKLRKNEFWAVDNVSFELRRGETLGIIGANGSGKSTILKMLNGIYMPDKGSIEIKGKVGALIEVGAGFHPLLTGRENIYVNGAILGMSKKEIDEKFDDIAAFADIGDFLDSPVKTYSSGMYVRLGFAVAIHCDPDILLIDEVLAVGDSAFRNKCFKRLNEIKQNGDLAIVFVSHDLYIVEKFCDKGIFLKNGIIQDQGEIHKIVQNYQYEINQFLDKSRGSKGTLLGKQGTKEVEIINVRFLTRDGKEQTCFNFGDMLRIRIEYKAKELIHNPRFQISIWRYDNELICVFGTHLENIDIPVLEGRGVVECLIRKLPLLSNKYYFNIGIYDKTGTITYDWWSGNVLPNLSFDILPNQISAMMGKYTGICHLDNNWEIKQIDE